MVSVSLQEVISGEVPSNIVDAISGFSCRDKEVEGFLKEKAFDFERRNKSRTYLVTDSNDILGYYSLSLKALPFKAGVSKSIRRKIDGFSKDVDAAGMILIGQFGKDMKLAKNIPGVELFDQCIKMVYAAQKIIGGRYVMLECRDIEYVVSFYKNWDFEILQRDKTDNYMQMIRRL